MTDPIIPNPHDRFVKLTFGRIPLAKSFFTQYLPTVVLNEIDLDALQLTKDSFIDAELRESFSDLVFTTQLKNHTDVIVYLLFEHKSYADPMTALQMLKYVVRIYE